MKRVGMICLIVASILAALFAVNSDSSAIGGDSKQYKVTITNLTRGQPFSPVVMATHSDAFTPIFEAGQPASAELYQVAEDAMNMPLINQLTSDPEVYDVQTLTGANGPILPGETATMVIDSDSGFPLISLVSMLVVTNDGFFGLNGGELPGVWSMTYYSPAYDAGSEANNEYGRFIPGPPFGQGGKRDTANAEGYVHVHSGVVGKSSLIPEQHDWRNPVAKIVIELQ